MLSIAIVCAQGVKLHVHSLDHDHSHHPGSADAQSLADAAPAVEHTHLSIAHLSTDVSHSDHHDELLSESDACPDCLLTKIINKVPFFALFAVLFMLALFGLYRTSFNRRSDEDIYHSWQCHFTPPLRAPPC